MGHQKVALDSIRSLTFYKDEWTQSKRTSPVQQLTCIGKPCQYYQPDVVRCVNTGGKGLDVDWKCEADLPEQLRFGRVEVSCEGWSKPGDPNVLKGSCGLEYRLIRISNALNNDNSYIPSLLRPKDPYEAVFMIVWSLVLLFILYQFLKACFTSRNNQPRPTNPRGPTTGPQGGGGGGWFSGNRPNDDNDPPPPYSRPFKPSSSADGAGWRPGFWTGLGLGGLGAAMLNRQNQPPVVPPPQPSFWDWERPRGWWGQRATPVQSARAPSGSEGLFARRTAARNWTSDDRGEGSSDLGRMRSSTGYGSSRVR
ncbi:hypothetical protein M422DRAFT_224481 [Sphaerobolus stellatus SS14]|nr:hypothetical protein M422DRAFT_224481 [Sphaerobolus stellatus SS14]